MPSISVRSSVLIEVWSCCTPPLCRLLLIPSYTAALSLMLLLCALPFSFTTFPWFITVLFAVLSHCRLICCFLSHDVSLFSKCISLFLPFLSFPLFLSLLSSLCGVICWVVQALPLPPSPQLSQVSEEKHTLAAQLVSSSQRLDEAQIRCTALQRQLQELQEDKSKVDASLDFLTLTVLSLIFFCTISDFYHQTIVCKTSSSKLYSVFLEACFEKPAAQLYPSVPCYLQGGPEMDSAPGAPQERSSSTESERHRSEVKELQCRYQ